MAQFVRIRCLCELPVEGFIYIYHLRDCGLYPKYIDVRIFNFSCNMKIALR